MNNFAFKFVPKEDHSLRRSTACKIPQLPGVSTKNRKKNKEKKRKRE